jgi:hypothetical protein
MERCPTCRARVREAACPRCGTDLSRLLAIEAGAADELRRAIVHLAKGRRAQAREAVEASLRLKREPLAVALRDFLAGAGRDEVPAVDWFWRMEG